MAESACLTDYNSSSLKYRGRREEAHGRNYLEKKKTSLTEEQNDGVYI